jgi:hypothetical protein
MTDSPFYRLVTHFFTRLPWQEVADVLTHKDYKVIVQDCDIPFAPNSSQDLAGIYDPEECKRHISAAAGADRRVLRRRYSPICRRAG